MGSKRTNTSRKDEHRPDEEHQQHQRQNDQWPEIHTRACLLVHISAHRNECIHRIDKLMSVYKKHVDSLGLDM